MPAKKSVKEKELTIEEGMGVLNNILMKMDEEGVSLEDSFKLYNEGLNMVQVLSSKLEEAESKLVVVNDGEME